MIVLQALSQNYGSGSISTWVTPKPLEQNVTRGRLTFTRESFPSTPTTVVGAVNVFLSLDGVSYPVTPHVSFNLMGGTILDPDGNASPSDYFDFPLPGDDQVNRRVKIVFVRNQALRTGVILEGYAG